MIAFYSLRINGNFGFLLDAPNMLTVTFYKKCIFIERGLLNIYLCKICINQKVKNLIRLGNA